MGTEPIEESLVAFEGKALLARGRPEEVARAVRARLAARADEPIAVFDERSGRVVDVDLTEAPEPVAPRPPGRPRLGVVSREVSLLPRHWEWLAEQRGGASAALRRLVDAARKENAAEDRVRRAVDAAHRLMWHLAGDLEGFEEASRALYALEFDAFEQRIAGWPTDLREQLLRTVGGARGG